MQAFLQDDLSLFALPLFFTAIGLEAWWSRKSGLGWSHDGPDKRARVLRRA